MKKRWMKSVIEASKQDIPALPFQRRVRCRRAGLAETQKLRKIA
ncbi:hypothetical protein [Roseovarius faecimaris]|nr:hypothetical protein [Roseovarius faecimaris]